MYGAVRGDVHKLQEGEDRARAGVPSSFPFFMDPPVNYNLGGGSVGAEIVDVGPLPGPTRPQGALDREAQRHCLKGIPIGI